jgi:polyferredoxin
MKQSMTAANMTKRQNIRKALIIISFLLFPVTIFYLSPYLIVVGATEGVIAGSMIVFTIQFVLSLFFGKLFCAYACPGGGLQECLMLVNNKKAKGGKRDYIKYCLWVPWIIAIVILFIRAGGISEVDFFFHTTNGVSLNAPFTYMIYYGIVLIITILSMSMGRRAFCHYVCWMAPFMAIGIKTANWLKIPVLHIKADKTKCIGCKKCSEKCPMSLDVKRMVENEKMANSECILCGECIDVCHKKAITYSFFK